MKRQVLTAILCVILVFSSLTFVQAEDSQDWSKYTWDLTEFFPSNEAFLDTCSNIQEAVQL